MRDLIVQPSKFLEMELEKAKTAIDVMNNAKSLDEFEDGWKNFLHHIERVWTKGENHFGKSPRWNGWKGQFNSLRKSDPLLAYLINARGADEHTVCAITEREPSKVGINPESGNTIYIKALIVDNNGDIQIMSPQKISVSFHPARTRLLPITNRGRSYPVPTSHLGSPIDPESVIAVAEAGVRYYGRFLIEAEAFFVK